MHLVRRFHRIDEGDLRLSMKRDEVPPAACRRASRQSPVKRTRRVIERVNWQEIVPEALTQDRCAVSVDSTR
jgi:hypothetical protein